MFAGGVGIVGHAEGEAGLFAVRFAVAAAVCIGGIQVDFAALQVQVAAGSQPGGFGSQLALGRNGGVAADAADLAEGQALAAALLFGMLPGFGITGAGHAVFEGGGQAGTCALVAFVVLVMVAGGGQVDAAAGGNHGFVLGDHVAAAHRHIPPGRQDNLLSGDGAALGFVVSAPVMVLTGFAAEQVAVFAIYRFVQIQRPAAFADHQAVLRLNVYFALAAGEFGLPQADVAAGQDQAAVGVDCAAGFGALVHMAVVAVGEAI